MRIEDRGRTVLVTILIVTALFLSLVSVVSQISVTAAGAAKIWTDKEDYGPGETVLIFGAGFNPNAKISISVTRPNGWIDNWYIYGDSGGGFETSYQLDGIMGTYNVTATDGTNTATTTFTDASSVDFSQLGIGSDFTGTVVTIDSTNNYTVGTLPVNISTNGKNISYSYISPLVVSSKQYVWTSTDGTAGQTAQSATNVLKNTSGTVVGHYKTQWSVTFSQTGLSSDASGTVLTVGSNTYTYSTFPSSAVWVDDGTTYSYTATVSAGSGKRYVSTGVTGVSSPVHGSGSVSGSYKTQYQHTITSSPATGSGYVTVDGGAVTTLYTTPWWDSGSPHTIAANSPVTIVPDKSRYIYSSWSDFGAQSHSVSPTAVTTYTANFQPQYYFSVSSTYGSPTGQGWYNSGSSVSTVTRPVSGGTGIQYETTGWTGTGSLSSGGSAGSSSTGSFTINAYSTCTWNWKTQYYLTVETSPSDVDTPTGAGWYDTDVTAHVSTDNLVDIVSESSRYRFDSWTGASGTYSDATVVMDDAKTATANYVIQYYLTVETSPSDVDTPTGAGWYDTDVTAHVSTEQYVDIVSGSSRYSFDSWSGATGTYADATVVMDSAKTATANYVTQFNVIFDQSGLDSTATGTVVTVDGSDKVFTDLPFTTDWLDSGSSLDFAYSDTVASTVTGEQFALVSADQTSPLTVIGPTTTTATYKTQYYLTVTSSHGTTGGEGWYDSGDTAYATVTPLTVAGSDGTQYVFTGWSGDASGTDLTSDGITMDGPKTATADWKTQYYLTVKTDPDGTATIPGEGWYDPGTDVIITAPFEPKIPYLFAYWKVNEEEFPPLNNVIYVHMDGSKTAAAVYKDYLGDAKEEIGGLRGYASGPYRTGKIGRSEYTHFMGDLDKVKPNIDKAIKNLDTQRAGYDDKMNGFEYLRQAVMKLKHIINDVQYWLSKGKIPAADATLIINELETIRMELVNKAWAEALAEKALALKAIADAKARGKDTTRAEKEIAMVDSQLAQAAQKINEGKLAQAIQHFKNAFAHSHNAIKKAQDPAWDIGYKDWIDQLEVMDP